MPTSSSISYFLGTEAAIPAMSPTANREVRTHSALNRDDVQCAADGGLDQQYLAFWGRRSKAGRKGLGSAFRGPRER